MQAQELGAGLAENKTVSIAGGMRSQYFAADALSPFGRLRCSGLDRSSRVRNSEQY